MRPFGWIRNEMHSGQPEGARFFCFQQDYFLTVTYFELLQPE